MRKEYNFSHSQKNPYAKLLKKQITIRLETEAIDYFKKLAEDSSIPYQNLINLYLRDCVHRHRKISIKWTPQRRKGAGLHI